MASPDQRAKEVFDQALEKSPGEQSAYLDAACAGDPDLRAEVDDLLGALRAATAFMSSKTPRGSEAAGTVIDRYKLLEQIGEGGFGVVWMAEQRHPVRRKVALKVIKLGMDTRQVVARFEAERQALALMDHPNIAKVLDGGATVAGRPYFVMELVQGIPITEFCDQAGLSPRERIELFQRVCQAVQHAHQKGVIHRDLKPSNILVTLHDGVPVPKVIDFGIAKATGQELTQRTLFTEFRQMIGTPEYMAPEQAELSGLDVDTRADVYSLGVILYELLTGTKPFELSKLMDRSYVEILRQIREVEPPQPSTRVSTLGDLLAPVARRRQTEPSRLGRVIRGDLDWIAMKALEKDRSRRYPTANSLAEDLQRHLDDRPVRAGPPSARYRAAKFARRNRGGVVAGVLVLLALVAGVIGTLLSLQRALTAEGHERAARKGLENSEADARREAARANAVLKLTEQVLGAANPHSQKGANYTVRELLDDFDHNLIRIDEHPEVEASVRTTVGRAYRSLGMIDKAERHLDRALDLREQTLGVEHPRYAESLADRAQVLHDRGEFDAAEPILLRAISIAGRHPGRTVVVARWKYQLADLHRHRGSLDEAERAAEEALALLRTVRQEPDVDIASNLSILALVQLQRRNYVLAEALHRETLAQFRQLYGDESPETAREIHNTACAVRNQGRFEEAEELFRDALRLHREVSGADHPDVALTAKNLAAVVSQRGKHAEAERLYRDALKRIRVPRGAESVEVGEIAHDLAVVVRRQGRLAEAENLHRKALQILRVSAGETNPAVTRSLGSLGQVLSDLGEHEEAERLLRMSAERLREQQPRSRTRVVRAIYQLALELYRQRRYDEADELLRDALQEIPASDTGSLRRMVEKLREAIQRQGRPEEGAARKG